MTECIFENRLPQECSGMRLDAALRKLLPDMGVRGTRRLWREYTILCNQRPAPPSLPVSAGDHIRIQAKTAQLEAPQAELLLVQDGLAAISKPSGLHSAHLRGGSLPSVESQLASLFAKIPGNWGLLNRLDQATSGIVLAGDGQEHAARFKAAENNGQVFKEYYAVVHGDPGNNVLIKNRLKTSNTAVSGICAEDDTDPLRHTEITRLCAVTPQELPGMHHIAPPPFYLVRCLIKKGSRHQIRAHLAHLGHPIVGDKQYGQHEECRLYLHHARITLPGFSAQCPPDWSFAASHPLSPTP